MSAEPRDTLVNVIDVEATCWPGPPPEGQVTDIIEIGVCVVDVRSRERILSRPERSHVSAFCTELTGLTQKEGDTGLDFRAACAALVERHAARNRRWASWGDYDRKQFDRQCAALGVDFPFALRHINAKKLYAETNGLPRQKGMAGALRHADLPLEGRHHSGVDDAWNIAALVLRLADQDTWPGMSGTNPNTPPETPNPTPHTRAAANLRG